MTQLPAFAAGHESLIHFAFVRRKRTKDLLLLPLGHLEEISVRPIFVAGSAARRRPPRVARPTAFVPRRVTVMLLDGIPTQVELRRQLTPDDRQGIRRDATIGEGIGDGDETEQGPPLPGGLD